MDGEETEPVLVGDVMLSLPLPEGAHTIEFRYRNDAFSLGWKIAAICLLLFALTVPMYYHKRKKGRFER